MFVVKRNVLKSIPTSEICRVVRMMKGGRYQCYLLRLSNFEIRVSPSALAFLNARNGWLLVEYGVRSSIDHWKPKKLKPFYVDLNDTLVRIKNASSNMTIVIPEASNEEPSETC